MNTKEANRLKVQISKGEITEVFSELLENTHFQQQDEFILLNARHENLRKKNIKGIISNQEYTIQNNQLIDSLLEFINQITIDSNAKKETKKIHFTLSLDAEFNSEVNNLIQETITRLITITGDHSFEFQKVISGSIKIFLSVSKEGFEKLVALYENNDLSDKIGYKVLELQLVEKYPKEKSITNTPSSSPRLGRTITTIVLFIGMIGCIAEILNIINIIPNPPSPAKQELTIFVRDTGNNPALVKEGKITVTSNSHRSFNGSIWDGGKVNFDEILPTFLGLTITIGLKAKHWEIRGPSTFKFNGDAITLYVARDSTWGTIKGSVVDRRTLSPLKNATVQIIPYTSILTDSDGHFNITLPEKNWIKNPNERYSVKVIMKGYKIPSPELYEPRSSPLDIRLAKE
jgi:hypothetical protein